MAGTNKHKHLSRSDRQIILTDILNGSSEKSIADTLSKKINLHRQRTYISPLPLPYTNYKKCKFNCSCSNSCPDFFLFHCSRKNHSPDGCNGCPKIKYYRFDHYMYKPDFAHKEYYESLVFSRIGVNATLQEIRELGHHIEHLLK